MNIVFVGLASSYTPGMAYQENLLTDQFCGDGHSVTYLSDPAQYTGGEIVSVPCEDTIQPNGMRLIRLPYCKIGPASLYLRLRKFHGVYAALEQAKPAVIFCQSTQYWSILDVVRYKKAHPEVKLYADTHAAAYNSGTNWLSLHILHRVFYRYLIQKALPYLEKFFYIGEDERRFSVENYGVTASLLEFYPLGGIVCSEQEYRQKREKRREELGLYAHELLFVHSGKLAPVKKTEELLRAFSAVPSLHAKLVLIGSIPKEREAVVLPLIEADSRVVYLGWKSGAELQEYLCACDLYCQPGGVSSTVQNAICCGCPVMAYPVRSYVKDFDYQNILWVKTQEDIESVFRDLLKNKVNLSELRKNSWRCARELLDYRVLAARLYH